MIKTEIQAYAELQLLSAVMQTMYYEKFARDIKETIFVNPDFQLIFKAVRKNYEEKQYINVEIVQLLVSKEFKDREKYTAFLVRLSKAVGYGEYYEHKKDVFLSLLTYNIDPGNDYYVKALMELQAKRELVDNALETVGNKDKLDVFDTIEKTEDVITDIKTDISTTEVTTGNNVLQMSLDETEQAGKSDRLPGIPSGYDKLDEITGGWQKGDLIVLAARSSVGKTTLAVNFLVNAMERGFEGIFYSLEMNKAKLGQKILSIKSGIDYEKIKFGKLFGNDWKALTGINVNANWQMNDTAGLSIEALQSSVFKKAKRENIKFILVDYLQLLMVESKMYQRANREQNVSYIARTLKQVARENDLPVIAMCQLRRDLDTRGSKEPVIADLRETGDIENSADLVMLMYRPGMYNKEGADFHGQTKIIIAKHRNGRRGTINLKARLDIQKFENPNIEQADDYDELDF